MTRAPGTPEPRAAFRALTTTFLRRFFDNEITGGTNDLKTSFFYLIGFLAGPLTLIPAGLMVSYHMIATRLGPEGLRILSRPHKMFVIVLGMAAAGLLASVVWNSLMLERRDGLILGALPIRGRVVVLAKLAALAIYVFGLSAAIHAVSSLIFGVILSERAPHLMFMLMSPIAHFTAAVTSCAFAFRARGFSPVRTSLRRTGHIEKNNRRRVEICKTAASCNTPTPVLSAFSEAHDVAALHAAAVGSQLSAIKTVTIGTA